LFLFQRISVAIQRFNAVLPHYSFPSEDHSDFKPLCTFLIFSHPRFYEGNNNNNNNKFDIIFKN